MAFSPNAETVFADGPFGSPLQPSKPEIRSLLAQYEAAIDAYSSGAGSIAKSTRALLFADLAHAADVTAWVYADSTVAYNGIYRKSGASGAGSWTLILPLPFSFIIASDTGAGTPNAIQATTSIPVSGSALVWMNIFEANTASPVTVSFNGASALTVKTNSGNDVAVGGLTAGMIVMGIVSGSTFRLVSDQASAALVAQAEAAKDAAQAAQAAAEAAAAGVDLPPVAANRMLVDNAAGTARESKTFADVRSVLDLSGKYKPTLPYISQMDRFKAIGITPEDVDTGNEIGNDADAGIPMRQMLVQGIGDGISKFRLASGETYRVNSWDPSDAGHSLGILRQAETSNIFLDLNGGTIKGLAGIQESTVNAGAIARFESAHTTNGEDTTQRFVLANGKIDLTDCPPSSAGVTTIGGFALIGRWNVELDSVFFDHGRTTPVGDAIGVGGGDQSFFASNWNSLVITRCVFRGAPDLGVYLSNSGGRRALIALSKFIGNQNAIGLKRFASLLRVYGCEIREGDIGIYNPVADGLTDNMGGRILIDHCLIEKMQSRPIDINALADGSAIRNTEIWDWARRLSDGAETSLSESIGGVRIRSRRVVTQNVRMGMRDWALNTTAGKEQVGIVYSYNGAAGVTAGAEDCIHTDCHFENLYRRVRYETNTLRNAEGRGNKGYNISQSDLDNGQNIFPIVLADDIATPVLMPSNRVAVHFECQTTSNGSPRGEVLVNTSGAPAVTDINLASTTNILFSTGALANGGGTDGNLILSAHTDGKLYISNRTGGTLSIRVSFPRE